ncbi:MAG: hypothetical protein K2K32_06115, partial [Muribaculaceae bacterium]|nr:hypothetical protein [Muribaculaceae bacterium]
MLAKIAIFFKSFFYSCFNISIASKNFGKSNCKVLEVIYNLLNSITTESLYTTYSSINAAFR